MADSPISLLDVATRADIVNFDILDQGFSQKMLLNLSKHCVDWRLIGFYLELSKADIAAVNGDYQTVDEKRVGMLGRWKEKFAFKATYKVFIEALLASGRTEDAVDACKTIAKGLYNTITKAIYRMAGNFRRVLIFVIFVVDLAVTKISTHEN